MSLIKKSTSISIYFKNSHKFMSYCTITKFFLKNRIFFEERIMYFKKKFLSVILIFLLYFNPICLAEQTEIISNNIQAVETTQRSKYPDYSKMYVGNDKYEKFNRKMFNLNSKLNKFVAKPVHILWSSIMPQFGIDRIRDAYNNIEYPKRLASCILQKDGQAAKVETIRFLANSTLGLGGLFDPADKILKIKPTNENMEQALGKCKMKSGSYLVMPCLHSCTPRSLCGRAIEAALDPAVYIASPIVSLVKFGLMVNRTSYMQPLAEMLESTYADPYDIQKKLYGLENYIKSENLDRTNLISLDKIKKDEITGAASEIQKNNQELSDIIPLGDNLISQLTPDIVLEGYKTQTPVIDSMKTALFEKPDINKSMWNELSIWNRSFAKRIKTAAVEVTPARDEYKFKYILQKDKTAPFVIIYPSIGENAGAHHSVVFAKIFYDAGYSVVMQGSHFHWEFVKSMPQGYAPGLPQKDSEQVRLITSKILDKLKEKYEIEPSSKTIIGTSFGAMMALFVGEKESKENILGIDKYVAISPPISLLYALDQVDKTGDEFDKTSDDVKDKTAITAAKVLQISQEKNNSKNFQPEKLPFTDEEGKMITTFVMRQKLSDLIYTIENVSKGEQNKLYDMINNMSYRDYAEKYLNLSIDNVSDEIKNSTTLFALSDYLKNNDNYKIYHSLDDYLVNQKQIAKLKEFTGKKLACINCGSHLGFLYRKEFEEEILRCIKGEM